MEKERLEKIVKESVNYSEVSYKLYGNNFYGNRKTIKKYIEEYNIDISQFIFKSREVFGHLRLSLNEILVSDSTYNNNSHLKERLYRESLKERKCELCGQDEMWQGKKMSLILDHINGINNDNRIENLRIVCPNCNATLPTHGGKNIKLKSSKNKRKKYYVKKDFKEKLENKINGALKQRKAKRPEYEELLHDVKILGYLGTGRKYGVSDNAIRKWIKFYEKYQS